MYGGDAGDGGQTSVEVMNFCMVPLQLQICQRHHHCQLSKFGGFGVIAMTVAHLASLVVPGTGKVIASVPYNDHKKVQIGM